MSFRSNLAIAAVAATAACATHPGAAARPSTQPRGALPQLQRNLDALLADPALGRGTWGVLVRSLTNGDTLYALNSSKLLMPASTMKIVTTAAAAERLGWQFAYTTTLSSSGPVVGGVLDGDLVVVGSGDPSVRIADGSADRLFDEWAAALKQRGISTVAGRLIGDDHLFDDETLGFGWSWDDLPDDYAAGIGALQFNENAVAVTVSPGAGAGDFAAVAVDPAGVGVEVVCLARTAPAGTATSLRVRRLQGSDRLEIEGDIGAGAPSTLLTVSVDDPTLFFVRAARRALIARGIDIRGPAVDMDDIRGAAPSPAGPPAIVHRSPPLSDLAVRLMKASQNQYAETFLKTLATAAGTVGSARTGRAEVETILKSWGIEPGALIQRDGSGLSRYDYASADALVAILTHVHGDDRLRDPFVASLPIAGRDGSLASRMKQTAADGNARAKTGSMSNVRALAGYVTTTDGEPLAFAVLANNFETPADVINRATDALVVKLAEFRR